MNHNNINYKGNQISWENVFDRPSVEYWEDDSPSTVRLDIHNEPESQFLDDQKVRDLHALLGSYLFIIDNRTEEKTKIKPTL